MIFLVPLKEEEKEKRTSRFGAPRWGNREVLFHGLGIPRVGIFQDPAMKCPQDLESHGLQGLRVTRAVVEDGEALPRLRSFYSRRGGWRSSFGCPRPTERQRSADGLSSTL